MQRTSMAVCATLILVLTTQSIRSAAGQSDQPVADAGTPSPASAGVVTGQPFSAIRYERKVKALPGGKKQFIRNERYPVQLARDSEGRIYIQSVEPEPECDRPSSLVPPLCPAWTVLVFDPTTQTITHWVEGELAAHSSVVLKLSAANFEDAKNWTSAMPPDNPGLDDGDGATVTTKNLGEKVIEGVPATGVRTTAVVPAGHLGNKMPITTIHEIWISEDMKLVVKIVDGDPSNEETIAGLEHISLHPDPALFRAPVEYDHQAHYRKPVDEFVEFDMKELAGWFVGQPAALP